MEDLVKDLEELNLESKEAVSPKEETPIDMGTADYTNLKSIMKKTSLWAAKNVGKEDIITDWDLELMPEELRKEFDSYIAQKYIDYNLPEQLLENRIVAVYVEGKTVNFLHQFMTQKRVPYLIDVISGKETILKSQFVIPAGKTVILTEKQKEALARFERKRLKTETGYSNWYGTLVFKELSEDTIKKVPYSMVTVEDIKRCDFEPKITPVVSRGASSNFETEDFEF